VSLRRAASHSIASYAGQPSPHSCAPHDGHRCDRHRRHYQAQRSGHGGEFVRVRILSPRGNHHRDARATVNTNAAPATVAALIATHTIREHTAANNPRSTTAHLLN
jgi:hypothetical protein